MPSPADLYLRLHDDEAAIATTAPARRVGALLLAILMLAAVPLMWASADALAAGAPKAVVASSGHDEDSGPGSDGDEDEPDEDEAKEDDTGTRSQDATNTGDTGVSTKPETVTRSRDETRTKNTGVSTRGSR